MFLITKEYHFSAAHIIPGHPKCGVTHGHNYRVEVTVALAPNTVLGPRNWVMDFGKLDEIVDPYIETLDHTYIQPEDIDAKVATAEAIARWLAVEISMGLTPPVYLHEVTVWETPKCRATYRP
jgi:6-pyruvoyltetrahydropterin/6-carboxytetrahydropterin synthase